MTRVKYGLIFIAVGLSLSIACHRIPPNTPGAAMHASKSLESSANLSAVKRDQGVEGSHQSPAESALRELLTDAWHFKLRQEPLLADEVGIHAYSDQLSNTSIEAQRYRSEQWKQFLGRLRQIKSFSLNLKSKVDAEMFELIVQDEIGRIEFREYEVPMTSESGFYTDVARLPRIMTFQYIRDYENYLQRLRLFPQFFAQQIKNLKTGQSRKFELPRVVLGGVNQTIENLVAGKLKNSPFFKPFRDIPSTIDQTQQNRLKEEAAVVIMNAVVPSYRRFQRYMTKEYIPQARATIAAKELPGGERYYEFLIHRYTSLHRNAEQIHKLGLQEVDRIYHSMQRVVDRLRSKGEYDGSFQGFIRYLREDSRFYAKSADQLLKQASFIAKKIDGILPRMFAHLPRQPYTVEAVPMAIAENYTAGRYVGAAINGPDPGRYWLNTTKLKSRPLYNLPALTLHEAVPGHHLQNALAKELEELPEFRRFTYLSYYGEGWALYAEWLGVEMGVYTNEYQEFGRLSYEMWRACRLVVDTGIHMFSWTREQARSYLLKYTALSRHEVATEVDRYISWPGQALSYKMGELKIRELRGIAEEKLGIHFDVRQFHHAILSHGPLSLGLLEEIVHRYIETTKPPAAERVSAEVAH